MIHYLRVDVGMHNVYLETGVTHDVTIISLWRLLVHTIFHIVDPYITIILHL